MTAAGVRRLLRDACTAAGGQLDFAEMHAVSPQYVSDVLNDRREPGEAILKALGLERVITYRATKATQGRATGE